MIRSFQDNDFHLLEKWVTSKELLFQFAGTDFNFPITLEQIQLYHDLHKYRKMYIYVSEDGIERGFGEIILQKSKNPRLARLIIGNPTERNKGYGEKFVNELVNECKIIYNPPKIDLYVWDMNFNAIKCYQKVGFELLDNPPFAINIFDKIYKILKMSLYLK